MKINNSYSFDIFCTNFGFHPGIYHVCNLSKNAEERFFSGKMHTLSYLLFDCSHKWPLDGRPWTESDVAMAFPMHAYDMAPVTMARIIMNEKHETCGGL